MKVVKETTRFEHDVFRLLHERDDQGERLGLYPALSGSQGIVGMTPKNLAALATMLLEWLRDHEPALYEEVTTQFRIIYYDKRSAYPATLNAAYGKGSRKEVEGPQAGADTIVIEVPQAQFDDLVKLANEVVLGPMGRPIAWQDNAAGLAAAVLRALAPQPSFLTKEDWEEVEGLANKPDAPPSPPKEVP